MTEPDPVEAEIVVRGERCRVTAARHRGRWRATGKFRGTELTVHRADTPAPAFEWWANKAGMHQSGPGRAGPPG